ncbi:FAD/NAD(P)-binding domain-containing protein [Heliocybe sulcata]|uniref:FAD/NAD(P)-binding domain-containing protein n=1 Tax=Heliocybe sulcata TaxID=5364 RepID=A0A5C3MRT6_9AGAM|nr:FAD/NAD(P)-binding domain-containing protein [Heliocybe sulcata]
MAAVLNALQPVPSALDKSHLGGTGSIPKTLLNIPTADIGGSPSSGLSLPTLNILGVKELPSGLNVLDIARKWMQTFKQNVSSCDVEAILSLFVEDALWRDLLSMTWDFRTFQGKSRIRQFLLDRLPASKFTSVNLDESTVGLQRPYPDLAWVQALFDFEGQTGKGSGVFRLVPMAMSDGALQWKAHLILTNLVDLKQFPEKTRSLNDPLPNQGSWVKKRRQELEFRDIEPKVLVVGAGHSGLEIAARLKNLNIPTLVVERHPRIGDSWRTRYESLHLHTFPEADHMPYLPFPSTWPVYPSASKFADWLESYAHNLELDVWTSAEVIKTEQDEISKKWTVVVKRLDSGQERTFTVDHLICALGWTGGLPKMPVYPGMELFKGRVMHSSQHKTGRHYRGKKVVVIGSCTSSHDICADLVSNGVDVTMVQRSPTYIMSVKKGNPRVYNIYTQGLPTESADLINASYPNGLLKLMHKRMAKTIAEADAELLEGLRRKGFRLSMGDDGSGLIILAWTRGGGYYIDMGASQMIIDGKIKLKSGSPISHFTEAGVKFQDGSELSCDVVIFATGYQTPRDGVIDLLGHRFADQVKPIWGLDAEGEFNGAWRNFGVPNLWYMMAGSIGQSRFWSKHLALQIKALEEGMWDGSRYYAQ